MALEILFNDIIHEGEMLARHPEATHINCKSGRCRQFRVNPSPTKSMIEIPTNTAYFHFKNYSVYGGNYGSKIRHIDYGYIVFHDSNNNILKEHAT
jgi:hypothetical protein